MSEIRRKYLIDLTNKVDIFLDNLDKEMNNPSTEFRGKNIAKLSNYLEMANDSAKHFGLNIPLNKC